MQQEAVEVCMGPFGQTWPWHAANFSAIEAMDKYHVEKVRGSWLGYSWVWQTRWPDLGYCPVHQERSQRSPFASKPFRRSRLLQFDSRKGATWHCVVGRNFGSFVTHGEFWTRYTNLKGCANCLYCRDETLHLLLPRTLRHPPLQDAIDPFEYTYFVV